MATHHMKLTPAPFKRLIEGEKRLELRLYDAKRQQVNVDDDIVFTDTESGDTHTSKVTGLLIYSTFAELLDDIPTRLLGYPESERSYLRTSMYEVYTPEQEAQHGALGKRLS